jgi:hypothetical protein
LRTTPPFQVTPTALPLPHPAASVEHRPKPCRTVLRLAPGRSGGRGAGGVGRKRAFGFTIRSHMGLDELPHRVIVPKNVIDLGLPLGVNLCLGFGIKPALAIFGAAFDAL